MSPSVPSASQLSIVHDNESSLVVSMNHLPFISMEAEQPSQDCRVCHMCWMEKPMDEFLNRLQTRYCKICRSCRSGQLLRYYGSGLFGRSSVEKKKALHMIHLLKKELAHYTQGGSKKEEGDSDPATSSKEESSPSSQSISSAQHDSHNSNDVMFLRARWVPCRAPSNQVCYCIAKRVNIVK